MKHLAQCGLPLITLQTDYFSQQLARDTTLLGKPKEVEGLEKT
jgi:hypothetical protein